MATDKQNAANKQNAQLSCGPKTQEGKDVSKRNALQTGLHSLGFVLPEHLETEIIETMDWIDSKICPENHIERELEASLAFHMVMNRECYRQQIGRKLQVAQRTLLCWDDDRLAEASDLLEDLAKKPVAVLRRLKNSKHGCMVLIEHWQQLDDALVRSGRWTEGQKALALDLLGISRAAREDGSALDAAPEGVGLQAYLRALVLTQVKSLEERRDGDLNTWDDTERQNGLLGNLTIDPVLDNLKRIGTTHLNKVLNLCKALDVRLGTNQTQMKLDVPRRARGETKFNFNTRMGSYLYEQGKRDLKDREAANAKRLADIEAARLAEFTAQPQFREGIALDVYFDQLRDWHRRVHHPEPAAPELTEPPISLRTKLADALPPAPEAEPAPQPEPAAPPPITPPAPPTTPRTRRNRRRQ